MKVAIKPSEEKIEDVDLILPIFFRSSYHLQAFYYDDPKEVDGVVRYVKSIYLSDDLIHIENGASTSNLLSLHEQAISEHSKVTIISEAEFKVKYTEILADMTIESVIKRFALQTHPTPVLDVKISDPDKPEAKVFPQHQDSDYRGSRLDNVHEED